MSAPVLVARALTRRYRQATVVNGIDFTLHSGQIIGITGPSGCGKSTLLRLLAGIERPDHGQLTYESGDAWPHPRTRTACYPRPGYVMPVFQDPAASLNPRWPLWRTITEPLTAPAKPRHTTAVRRAAAQAALRRVHLGHLNLDHRPAQLSGGQQQRIAILRALTAGAALITADEPTARQDPITAAAISQLLTEAAAAGAAIAIASHDPRWLARVSHHIHPMAG